MFAANDTSTTKAIQRLLRVVRAGERPLVLWVGAGVSAWAGYPLWPQLADIFHSAYLRAVDAYDAPRAQDLLSAARYPEYFSLCKASDRAFYYRLLTENLARPPIQSSVHRRFCDLLADLLPIRVVTTNADEALEPAMAAAQVLQRSDLERAADLLRRGEPFFCKLHGTISAVESVVFTKEEYDALVDAAYLDLLGLVFNQASVIFLGYSLADQYVLASIKRSDSTLKIVGTGPHFLLTDNAERASDLPAAIQIIRYQASPHQDHRSPLQVCEMIRSIQHTPVVAVEAASSADHVAKAAGPPMRSSYYIADLYPPGTWTTSQEVEAVGSDGRTCNVLVGQGFEEWEVGNEPSRALHDLAVGVLCFDQTYVPLSAVSRVHDLLGAERFWRLHGEGALRFVLLPSTPSMIFPSKGTPAGGDLGMATLGFQGEARAWTVEDVIESELRAVPGREREAEAHFESLKASTVTLDHDGDALPMATRSALLHPRLQSLIGFSDAGSPTSIPRWLAFPCLRLFHVVQAATACRDLGIPALKIPFGGERLIAAVIGSGQSVYTADEVAGYLVLQRATGELGTALEANPMLLDALVQFRSTPTGERLRREVFAALDVSEGAELEAALNGGLRQAIPASVMDSARDSLEQLMVPQGLPVRPHSPAVWSALSYSDNALHRWRTRARQAFKAFCAQNSLGSYDECPCGSQEKVRFCCEAALRD